MAWGRDPEDYHKNDQRKTKPIEAKESYRWLLGYRRACTVAAAVPGTQIISISDREGDIYECFVEAQTIEGPRAERIIRPVRIGARPRNRPRTRPSSSCGRSWRRRRPWVG